MYKIQLQNVLFGIILIVAQASCQDVSHEPGMCMFNGQCGDNYELENAAIRGEIPCFSPQPAKNIIKDSVHYNRLKEVCPVLVPDEGDVQACCDIGQINTLDSQLAASVLMFGRCPSCLENFRNLYCIITCSPNQATFLNVTRTIESKKEPGSQAVTDETIYIDQVFADGIHGSCEDVLFPQTNGKAITLVCNGFSGDACTTQMFLNYLGSTNNGVAPLNMDFHQIGNSTGINSDVEPAPPEEMEMMTGLIHPCNTSPREGEPPCSCTDCLASCPAPPPTQAPPEEFMIGDADGVAVVMLIAFLAFVVGFLAYLLLSCACHKNNSTIDFRMLEIEKNLNAKTAEVMYENFGRHLINKEEISCFQKLGKKTQDAFRNGFAWWGTWVARHPFHVLVPTIAVVIALIVGIQFIILTNDPIELWSSEGSRGREEKTYYDEHFGAFYRTEQVIMKLKPEFIKGGSIYQSFTSVYYNFSDILQKEYMLELLEIQSKIRYMTVNYTLEGETKNATFNDICLKPLEPDNNNCTIMSVMNYWQNDPNELNKTTIDYDNITENVYDVDWRDHFLYCVQSPAAIQDTTPLKQNCMGDFGGPVFPFLAVGGQGEDGLYNEAVAFILTFVVKNFDKDDYRTGIVKIWEREFLKVISEWETEHFDFAYFSERSPEDELERSSETDVVVFLISYLVIFLYITLALGTYSSFKRCPVDSKASLGIAGILVILASVFMSIGFFGYVGYATSLIVIEVVPFLVLAIGADNVFILTLEYQRDKRREYETREEQIGRVFGEVAPSMFLCSLTECVVFFLGALTDMPAVQQFALAAAVAILFDFLLQITAFLAVLSLDARRQEANRLDILCCCKINTEVEKDESLLQKFFHKYYAPFLMNDIVRFLVMVLFAGVSCWCVFLSANMTIGLDQDLSVPKDSYVLKYFDYMEKYLDVGIPVYFVTKGPYKFEEPSAGKFICGSAGCDTYSLTQQVSFASQNPEYWKIETAAASWYDDYIDWIPPQGLGGRKSCCRKQGFNESIFCPATNAPPTCVPCVTSDNYTSEEFMDYLPWFLIDNPGLECNKGGHAAYGAAVNITNNYKESGKDVVEASYFMAYHSVCIKSVDCTENLVRARELADNITRTLRADPSNSYEDDFSVYAYGLYYVFYEQYLTMPEVTMFQLGICLIPTFFFNLILLGFDVYSGFVSLITIMMILVDTAGLSSLWGVHLNAVSLINLVAAIGLSVEFTTHVVRTFSLKTQLTRKDRVIDAMASMGPAVFAGVALTNLPGIIVLNWATAQLIQIFFFRMCLIITLLGTAHGLIFLPVFLSYFGPPVNKAILYEKQEELRKASEQHGFGNNAYKGDTMKRKMDEVAGEKQSPLYETTAEDAKKDAQSQSSVGKHYTSL